MQFSVSSEQLEQYKSIPALILTKSHELFNVMKLFVKLSGSGNSYYFDSDLCELERSGLYAGVGSWFNERGNHSYCVGIDNTILTKGYTATLLHYIETANRFFSVHSSTFNYTLSQRQVYLSDPFFT